MGCGSFWYPEIWISFKGDRLNVSVTLLNSIQALARGRLMIGDSPAKNGVCWPDQGWIGALALDGKIEMGKSRNAEQFLISFLCLKCWALVWIKTGLDTWHVWLSSFRGIPEVLYFDRFSIYSCIIPEKWNGFIKSYQIYLYYLLYDTFIYSFL